MNYSVGYWDSERRRFYECDCVRRVQQLRYNYWHNLHSYLLLFLTSISYRTTCHWRCILASISIQRNFGL